jgi:hypothetical protein
MVKGCHWKVLTSGTLRKSHIPALYLNDGFSNRISIAPEGCMNTPTIFVARRARTCDEGRLVGLV